MWFKNFENQFFLIAFNNDFKKYFLFLLTLKK